MIDSFSFQTPREAIIYEIAHTIGMMKREQEIQQEVINYEFMYNMKYQDASNGWHLRLHSDKWFTGMTDNINKMVKMLETFGERK
ncbi:MAG: hypothetical protein KHX55_02305 [Proteobacteria bacterium]|nr:hypothetical protein [Pseudomonadota bacterium]